MHHPSPDGRVKPAAKRFIFLLEARGDSRSRLMKLQKKPICEDLQHTAGMSY